MSNTQTKSIKKSSYAEVAFLISKFNLSIVCGGKKQNLFNPTTEIKMAMHRHSYHHSYSFFLNISSTHTRQMYAVIKNVTEQYYQIQDLDISTTVRVSVDIHSLHFRTRQRNS